MITSGSIVRIVIEGQDNFKIETIAMVKERKGDELFCDYAISSINGQEFVKTKTIVSAYEGDNMQDVERLCNAYEFDEFIYLYPDKSIYRDVE